MQADTLGQDIWKGAGLDDLERGDLVFWKGHVGIMCSPSMILHASARDMHVEVEPVAQAIDRIRPIAGEPRSVRRFG
jgi:cell wall-associated NlpC family hydrolase